MKKLSLVLFSTILVLNGFSQKDPSVIVSDFTLYFGTAGGESESLTEQELLDLAPSAREILFSDDDEFYTNYFDYSDSFIFNAALGLKFAKDGSESISHNPTLRLGISYENSRPLDFYRGSSETFRIDTLVSTQTGQLYFVDSTYSRSLSGQYLSERIKIDAAIVFRTSQEKRLSLFAGAGFTVGLSFNNKTDVSLYESSSVDDFDSLFELSSTERETVIIPNEGAFVASAYVPFGLEYRLSNSHPVWSQLYLSYEMRPSLEVFEVPELKTLTLARFQALFGFRFEVGQEF